MSYIFDAYLPAHPLEGLLLAARWQSADIDRITRTVDWARQHRVPVVLFGPVPEYDMPLPLLLAYSIAWKRPDMVGHHRIGERESLDAELQELAASTWRVPYISLYKAICRDGECRVYSDTAQTVPLMFDDSHLSSEGSLVIGRQLVDKGHLRALSAGSGIMSKGS